MVKKEAVRLHPLQLLALSLLLVVLIGWLLKIGQSLLLPILMALISVYVLVEMADWLCRVPVVGKTPAWARRALVLLGFIGAMALLTGIILSTAEAVMSTVPTYQENLARLLTQITTRLGIETEPDWKTIRAATLDKINLQALLGMVLNSVGSLAGVAMMVVIYAMFLLGERGGFSRKLSVALPGEGAEQTRRMIADINHKIGDYLAVKTLINIILAAISWAIMWLCNVDYALFWALVIGLLNYIPYVGSFMGVVFPVLLTLAQFGSLQTTLLVAGLLTAAQMYVGNVLEPTMIGKQVNLSPFVVMVALSLWSALWGVAGAILAIPLTVIIAIVLAEFEATRPLAVLLAEDVSGFERAPAPQTHAKADQ